MLLDFIAQNNNSNNGTNNNIEVVCVLADDGVSGAHFDRPAFKEMIDRIETGEINCCIVKDFSRLGRDHIGMGKYIERYFAAKGIRFIAVNERYDSINVDVNDIGINSLLVPFKNIINEAFLEDISVKTKTQLEIKRKNGEVVCNFAPYGYVKQGGKFVTDKAAADIVRFIFNSKIAGYNEGLIALMLNEKGVLPPAEHKRAIGLRYHTPFGDFNTKWSPLAVRRILSNRVYIGFLEQGKRTKAGYRMKKYSYRPRELWNVAKNSHEPIVSELDFNLAQELKNGPHMFSGLIICGLCKKPMTTKITTSTHNKKYINYICSTHKKTGSCFNNNISELSLKKLIFAAIPKQRRPAGTALAAQPLSLGRSPIEEIIKENENYLVKAYEHFLEGTISEAEYLLFSKSFKSKINAARFKGLTHEKEPTREIIARLIKSIIVNSNKDITINFRYML
jgi:DNA invertase Pin-like site-specific DNA recombinase